MTVFMLSLAGIPPLIGFVAKLYVFGSAVEGGWWWLAAVGVVNSVISAYYYLRVVAYMYMRRPMGQQVRFAVAPALVLALVLAVLGTVIIGLLPSTLVWASQVSMFAWGL